MKRKTILTNAEQLITGDREEVYGEPHKQFKVVATFWSAYLNKEIQPHEVCSMMELLKIALRLEKPEYEDNYVDAAGYAALSWELACEKK